MISDNSRKSGSFVNYTYQLLANVPTQTGHIAAFHHCWECRVIGRRHLGQHCKQPRPGGPLRTGPRCREGTWCHRRSMQEGHDGERTTVVWGKRATTRVAPGGRRILKKKKTSTLNLMLEHRTSTNKPAIPSQ